MIPTQPFGATGHDSTLTLFGAAAFSPESTGNDADRVLELLLHHGVNHIDTAPSYGNGNSEVLIGAWMAQHRLRGLRWSVRVTSQTPARPAANPRSLRPKCPCKVLGVDAWA